MMNISYDTYLLINLFKVCVINKCFQQYILDSLERNKENAKAWTKKEESSLSHGPKKSWCLSSDRK